MLVLEHSAVQGNPCSRCTMAAFAKTIASVMTVQLVCWVSMMQERHQASESESLWAEVSSSWQVNNSKAAASVRGHPSQNPVVLFCNW